MSVLRAFLMAAWLMLNLVIEIFAAMLVYIYLDLYHRVTFGELVGIARDILISFTQHLTNIAPEFANQANTSLLGEFGAKSILLLVIGLLVSAVLRSLTMVIFTALDAYRKSKIGNPVEESGSAA
ncbi:MAG: hypothetical protein KTR19_12090 [Hyphomicrobiales bacterium]|nr:hypothetical protein [Hyphomicrobiales bacterium]